MVRILLITYEYDAYTFSGNGTYAQGLVRGLRAQTGVVVEVACGAPYHDPSACVGCPGCVGGIITPLEGAPKNPLKAPKCIRRPSSADVLVQLPSWCSLDGSSAHRDFCAQLKARLDERYLKKERPDVILIVDWHGLPVATHLRDQFPVPIVYLNFRVFGRGERREFLKAQEWRCVDAAWLTLALSQSDRKWLSDLSPMHDEFVKVLLPPLRLELERLAAKPKPRDRLLLTCVVRLSSEKEPERFVKLVEHLAKRMVFDGVEHGYPDGITPVLITGRAELEDERGEKGGRRRAPLVDRFLAAHPSCTALPYQTPKGLADLFSRTRLMVHPPAYDAFGMSVVEAAAFGAPTVFVKGADVGAKALLTFMGDEAFFEADMDDGHAPDCAPADRPPLDPGRMTADQVRQWRAAHEDGVHEIIKLLKDPKKLDKIGQLARKRATAYTEEAHGQQLMAELGPVVVEAELAKAELAEIERREATGQFPPGAGRIPKGDDFEVLSETPLPGFEHCEPELTESERAYIEAVRQGGPN